MSEAEIKDEFRKLDIPFSDLHTHSVNKYTDAYEGGKMPPSSKVVDAAVKLGMSFVGISDHSYEIVRYEDLDEDTILNHEFNSYEPYVNYLRRVKSTLGIPLKMGLELHVRSPEHLSKIDSYALQNLDFVLIETFGKLDLEEVRRKLGNVTIILAHPPIESLFGGNPDFNDVGRWLTVLKENDIFFELNRTWLKDYLEKEHLYTPFFETAKKIDIAFTIGSDYHLFPQNYPKFYTTLLQVIRKYGIRNFHRF
jgi:histidinol phosphatase-like PHP family hydrolase